MRLGPNSHRRFKIASTSAVRYNYSYILLGEHGRSANLLKGSSKRKRTREELEEVKGLLAKGQQVGVLTFAEIVKAVSELDLDDSDVEELHGFLEKQEIV